MFLFCFVCEKEMSGNDSHLIEPKRIIHNESENIFPGSAGLLEFIAHLLRITPFI